MPSNNWASGVGPRTRLPPAPVRVCDGVVCTSCAGPAVPPERMRLARNRRLPSNWGTRPDAICQNSRKRPLKSPLRARFAAQRDGLADGPRTCTRGRHRARRRRCSPALFSRAHKRPFRVFGTDFRLRTREANGAIELSQPGQLLTPGSAWLKPPFTAAAHTLLLVSS